jgi:hypothetical protein
VNMVAKGICSKCNQVAWTFSSVIPYTTIGKKIPKTNICPKQAGVPISNFQNMKAYNMC